MIQTNIYFVKLKFLYQQTPIYILSKMGIKFLFNVNNKMRDSYTENSLFILYNSKTYYIIILDKIFIIYRQVSLPKD